MRIDDMTQLLPKHLTRKWATRRQSEIENVIVHQAFTKLGIQELAGYYVSPGCHVDNLGCPGYPYTFAIEPEGRVIQANPVEAMTFHFGDSPWRGDLERSFLSVQLLGDFGDGPPPPVQLSALIQLLEKLAGDFSSAVQPLGVHGHCHWGKACCPGRWLAAFLETYRDREVIDPDLTSTPFGSRAEVSKYQREHNLRVTGVADYDTLRRVLRP